MYAADLNVREIDHEAIRAAGEKYEAAKHEFSEAQKALSMLERGRPDGLGGTISQARELAVQKDAKDDAAARLKGGTRPKGRRHLAEYEKSLEDARHETLVAEEVRFQTLRVFEAAVSKHGAEWLEDVSAEAEKAEKAFYAAVERLAPLYRELLEAYSQRRAAGGGGIPAVSAVSFDPRQLVGVDVHYDGLSAQQRHSLRAQISVSDVVGALGDLGKPIVQQPMAAFGMADAFKASAELALEWKRTHDLNLGAAARGQTAYTPNTAPQNYANVGGVPVVTADPEDRAELAEKA